MRVLHRDTLLRNGAGVMLTLLVAVVPNSASAQASPTTSSPDAVEASVGASRYHASRCNR